MKTSILGMNERNLIYIRPHNKPKDIQLADDKLATKDLLKRTGIYTPRLYGKISSIREFEKFNWDKLPTRFVVKPNMGYAGEGVIILRSKYKKKDFVKLPLEARVWIASDGTEWDYKKLKSHILNILDGNFSLSGMPDSAFIERRILLHPDFKKFVKRGIPDIRVIVYNKVPVMAMLRLPTKRSRGKSNLALGAIGVGIDIGSGRTTTAMTKFPRRKIIERHPDTDQELRDFQIPFWDRILEIACEAQIASNLGFLGVDIAIDKIYGPEILELNARPGLDIQLANLEGLADRLRRVEGLKIQTVARGVRIAKELFGGDIEKRVEEISGLEVIGIIEKVKILNKTGTRKQEIKAKIDTGAGLSSIDWKLASSLGFKDALKYYESFGIKEVLTNSEVEELSRKKIWKKLKAHRDIIGVVKTRSAHGITYRIIIPIVYFLAGHKIVSKTSVFPRSELEYPMIIGRRDLKNFLIDPTKKLP